MILSRKFINKYMRLARQVGEDQNPCYSRKIGVVIVDPARNKILGTGYNGPPRGTPHCDGREYLEKVVWPQLDAAERRVALENAVMGTRESCPASLPDLAGTEEGKALFLDNAAGCKTCPRRLAGAKSGERTELCSCEHGERNAIYNATCDLHGSWAFCWCGVPCWDCTKALIQAGVVRVYCTADPSYANKGGPDYSFGSRWLFEQRGILLNVEPPENYLQEA